MGYFRIIATAGLLVLSFSPEASAFRIGAWWTSTATNPSAPNQGTPVTVTWGLVPNGTSTTGGGASNLITFLDTTFGAGPGGTDYTLRPWFPLINGSFERWEALSGLTLTYEPNDDGVPMSSSNNGILGVRGDVRIGGRNIDGPSNVLAFNSFPNNGDMVIDTSDGANFGSTGSNFRFFRNTIMHEHGHGIGLNHVESNNARFLMEPFIQTTLDGPQLDDLLGAQRLYGDIYEKTNGGQGNGTFGNATPLGLVATGTTRRIGTNGNSTGILPEQTDFVSISRPSDIDFFSFSVASRSRVDLELFPMGASYAEGPQGGAQQILNSATFMNLSLSLLAPDGTTLLTQSNSAPAGSAENISGFILENPGTYYARITGVNDSIQLYRLSITANDEPLDLPGDFDQNGLYECADIDSLVAQIASGANNVAFDLNSDGLVNGTDLNQWLSIAGAANLPSGNPYIPGDANLDGTVDGSDFGIWNSGKFTSTAAWCSGDFTADGVIDGSDFGIWNTNKFTSADAGMVPEPGLGLWLLMGLGASWALRRQ